VSVDVIATAGNKLWKELAGDVTSMRVTGVSLAFTGIETAESGLRKIDGFFKSDRSTGAIRKGSDLDYPDLDDDVQGLDVPKDGIGFTCLKCKKRITAPTLDGVDEAETAETLRILRQEHDDFHFAQELSRAEDTPIDDGTASQRPKKKRKKEPQNGIGIEKFFRRK
jgi:DNA polymerase eta